MQLKLLRHLWLERLPKHAQTILASRPELSLEQLFDLADKIIEISPSPAVHAMTAVSECRVVQPVDLHSLANAIKQLTLDVNELRRTRSRSRSRSVSRGRSSSTDGLCWYHARFDVKAQKCTHPPCMGNAVGSQ